MFLGLLHAASSWQNYPIQPVTFSDVTASVTGAPGLLHAIISDEREASTSPMTSARFYFHAKCSQKIEVAGYSIGLLFSTSKKNT